MKFLILADPVNPINPIIPVPPLAEEQPKRLGLNLIALQDEV